MSTPNAAANASAPSDRELDVSLGRRLAWGFGLLFVVVASFAAVVFVWHSRSVDAQREYAEHIAPVTGHADALERRLLYVGIGMRSYLLLPDEPRRQTFNRSAAEAQAAVRALERAASAEDRPIANQIAAEATAYIEGAARLVAGRHDGALRPEDEERVVALREQ